MYRIAVISGWVGWIALSLTNVTQGQDSWSRFRGPNGGGVDADSRIPAEFGPDKNLFWKTPLPAGHSSPVVYRDNVFLTAVEDDKLLTICLDLQSGKQRWRRQAPRDRASNFREV